MLGRGRRAEMCLERDVAKILECNDAERIGVTEDARYRHGHRAVEPGHVCKRQSLEAAALRMDSEDLRRCVTKQQSKVPAIGGVAGEGYDLGIACGEASLLKKLIDAAADVVIAHTM